MIALGKNLEQRMAELSADLPVGIESFLAATQPEIVDVVIAEFRVSLWQAIAIAQVISFVALGVRAGLVVAIAILLTMATVFVILQFVGIDLRRISRGILISSWVVAVLFVPVIGALPLLAPKSADSDKEGLMLRACCQVLLGAIMRMRLIAFAATVRLFVLAMPGLSQVPQQFFPP